MLCNCITVNDADADNAAADDDEEDDENARSASAAALASLTATAAAADDASTFCCHAAAAASAAGVVGMVVGGELEVRLATGMDCGDKCSWGKMRALRERAIHTRRVTPFKRNLSTN